MTFKEKTSSGLHHFGTFLLFACTILLIFVSVTAPVLNDFGMLYVRSYDPQAIGHKGVTYGTFGYCINDNRANHGHDSCSGSHVGYRIAYVQEQADSGKTTFSSATAHTVNGLTNVMVLHVVACVLCFIACCLTFGGSHIGTLVGSVVAAVTWVVVLVAMVCDWIIFGTVKRHVNRSQKTSGSHARYGSGMWLLLAVFIILFFSVIIVFVSCFQRRRKNRVVAVPETKYDAGTVPKRRKRFILF